MLSLLNRKQVIFRQKFVFYAYFFFQIYYVICSKFQIWFHFPQYSCPVYVSFCLICSYLFIYCVYIFYIMWILKTINRLLNFRNILNINMLSNKCYKMFFKDFLLKLFLETRELFSVLFYKILVFLTSLLHVQLLLIKWIFSDLCAVIYLFMVFPLFYVMGFFEDKKSLIKFP